MTRTQRNTLIAIVLMLPIIAGDLGLYFSGKLPLVQVVIPFVLSFSILIFIWFVIKRRDGQKVEADERSIKIAGRAFTYSWLITLYFLVLFILNEQLGILQISASSYLGYLMMAMVFSNLIFRAVLNRKGDVAE
jgi:hypothetical protein